MSEVTNDQPVDGGQALPDTGVGPTVETIDPADIVLELEESQPGDDPDDEFEFEGKKLTVPKSVKAALEAGVSRHKDYTQKTQELAEGRRGLETQQQQVRQQAEAQAAFIQDVAGVHSLQSQLALYAQPGQPIDWNALRQLDASQGSTHAQDAMILQQQLQTAQGALHGKMQQRQQEQERETANQRQERDASLQRDIPGWSPELRSKLQERAVKAGFSTAEFDNSDARSIKLLQRLSLLENREAQRMRQGQAEKAGAVTPAATVRGANPAPKVGLSDELTGDEWLKRRNAEVQRKRT